MVIHSAMADQMADIQTRLLPALAEHMDEDESDYEEEEEDEEGGKKNKKSKKSKKEEFMDEDDEEEKENENEMLYDPALLYVPFHFPIFS